MYIFTDEELKTTLSILCTIANKLCRSGDIKNKDAEILLRLNADVVTSLCVKNMDLWYWYNDLLKVSFKDIIDKHKQEEV